MIEQYNISPDWDNEKIEKEYNKRKSRLVMYRWSLIITALSVALGFAFNDQMLIGVGVLMTFFAMVLERHTTFIMDALYKAIG